MTFRLCYLPVPRFFSRAALGLVGVGLALALACSESTEDTPGREVSDVQPKLVETVGEQSSVISRGSSDSSSRYGGVLLIDNDCTAADPAVDAASSKRQILMLPIVSEVHAGLMSIAENGESLAEPELAERFTVHDGGKVYEFVLRPNLKFSDGSPLAAEDFKWSWERALRKATSHSRVNDVLGWITGAQAVASGEAAELVGVEVVDDRTLVVRLEHPRHDFSMLLADPIASVLKRENVEEWDYEWENVDDPFAALDGYVPPEAFTGEGIPVGAGPFRLTQYSPHSIHKKCILERNDHYWGRPSYLDGVIFVDDLWPDEEMPEEETKLVEERAFEEHRIDYFIATPNMAKDLREGKSPIVGKVIYQEDAPYSQFLVFNPAHPPFDDRHFRRAMVAASNLSAVFNPLPIRWEQRLVPPEIAPESSQLSGIAFSPEAAEQELGTSNRAEGLDSYDVTYFSTSYGFFDDRFARLFETWEKTLGFKVVHDHTTSGFVSELTDSGKLHMREIEMNPHYPHPHAILRSFLSVFGEGNESSELAEVERMILSAVTEQDDAIRPKIYEDIERHILEEALALPMLISWTGYELVVQPWVHGFNITQYPSSVFHDVWFDETAPERALP